MKKLIRLHMLICALYSSVQAGEQDYLDESYSDIKQYKILLKEGKFNEALTQKNHIIQKIKINVPESKRSWFYMRVYTSILPMIREDASQKLKDKYVEIVISGLNDPQMHVEEKNRLAKGLIKIAKISKDDLGPESEKELLKAFNDKTATNRFFLELVYLIESQSVVDYIEAESKKNIPSITKFAETPEWGARLLLAQNNKYEVKKILAILESSQDLYKVTVLFDDLKNINLSFLKLTYALEKYKNRKK